MKQFIKGTNWVLAGILALFGFSTCETGKLMYGVPWASQAIQGKVTDKTTGKPIQGIEVKINLPENQYQQPASKTWTGITDNNGDFKLTNTLLGDSIPLVATDIDGAKNGLYKPDTIYVDFKNAQHIGGGDGWFQGELVATANFKLEAIVPDE